MRVRDIISTLRSDQFTYQGDQDLRFSGLSLTAPRRPTEGRFLIPRDASWPFVHEQPSVPSLKRTERLIERAFANGVSGVICSPIFEGSSLLARKNAFFTSDTYGLACHIARLVREGLTRQRITAITGSAGKTSTKEMLLLALRASEAGRVASTPGNHNLHRSSLRRISQAQGFDHVVLETSSSAFKAFRERNFSISPDVGIVTSIAEAHLNYMDSLENIARIKSDVFQRPVPGGTAVINLDTNHADLLVRRAENEGCRLVTYGETTAASIRLAEWDPETRQAVAVVDQERVEYTLGPAGKHTAMNSLAVIGALRALQIKNWRTGLQSLAQLEALEGRGQTTQVTLPNGVNITLIDEAYNANPASVRSSLASLAVQPVASNSRRVAILGDVLELGEQADEIHRSLADAVMSADLDEIFLFGHHMHALYEVLEGRLPSVHHWADLDDLRPDVPSLLRPNDTVLMKASGATGLKYLVKELTAAKSK